MDDCSADSALFKDHNSSYICCSLVTHHTCIVQILIKLILKTCLYICATVYCSYDWYNIMISYIWYIYLIDMAAFFIFGCVMIYTSFE